MWNTMRDEVAELVWLASMVGGLSALGVGIQLTLLRTYDGKVCGERCPAGQGLSHTGGCVPHAILALTSEVKSLPTAASAPTGRATPAITGWTISVAGAALIPPPEAVPAEALAGPSAPVAAPTPTKAAKAGAADKRRYAERGAKFVQAAG